MRILLARARAVLVVLTGGGPALLTDWYQAIPAHLMRRLLRDVARLDAANVHDWLCDAGLCPCGVDLDTETAELNPAQPAAAVAA